MASQVLPSLHSASLMTTYTRQDDLSIFPAIAIPTAAAIPVPKEPLEISTPGVLTLQGCP